MVDPDDSQTRDLELETRAQAIAERFTAQVGVDPMVGDVIGYITARIGQDAALEALEFAGRRAAARSSIVLA